MASAGELYGRSTLAAVLTIASVGYRDHSHIAYQRCEPAANGSRIATGLNGWARIRCMNLGAKSIEPDIVGLYKLNKRLARIR
jgi:hypothetical protein